MGDFGKYEVISEIGRGGMGIIYKAQDPSLNRFVAIKQLVLEGVDPDKKDEFRERFRREAILAAGLNHPNLISIYDVSITTANSYYVMELLEGRSFRQELETRPQIRISSDELLPIFKQVTEGLADAHQMNLVHRDIKPDNIFILPEGKVKLTDFGIARSSEPENSNLTRPGVMLGTLSYVSPEQLQDARSVDHRADIYSLGVVIYEALAGQLPFTGEGLTSTLMAIVSRDARPVHDVNPSVSAEVSSVVAKAMRKQATERYANVAEFFKDYERALSYSKGGNPGNTTGLKMSGSFSQIAAPISGSSAGPGLPVGGGSGGGTRPAQPRGAGIPSVGAPPSRGSGIPPPSGPARGAGIPSAGAPMNRPAPTIGAGGGADSDERTTTIKPWASGRSGGGRLGQPDESEEEFHTNLVKVINTVGRPGEEKGCFQEPSVVCVRMGKIIVGDTIKRKFQIYNREGRYIAETTQNPQLKGSRTAGGAFSKPSACIIDPRGRLFATDASDHYVRVYDGQGKYQREILNRQGKGSGITGIACDANGLIYISDGDNGCIQVINADTGLWMRKVATKGIGEGQLQLPAGIAVDRVGSLFVVDYGTSKISVFSKAGIFQRQFGGKGNNKGDFNVPRGIAIDRFDRLYVADSLNHRIQVFNMKGEFLFQFGGRGKELGKFVGPSDLSVDPENNCLYVADRGNCRVQIFELLQG